MAAEMTPVDSFAADWGAALLSDLGLLVLIGVVVFALSAPRTWIQTARRSLLPIGAALFVLPNIYLWALGLTDYEPIKALGVTLTVMCGPALVIRALWRRRRSTDRAAATMSVAGARPHPSVTQHPRGWAVGSPRCSPRPASGGRPCLLSASWCFKGSWSLSRSFN